MRSVEIEVEEGLQDPSLDFFAKFVEIIDSVICFLILRDKYLYFHHNCDDAVTIVNICNN